MELETPHQIIGSNIYIANTEDTQDSDEDLDFNGDVAGKRSSNADSMLIATGREDIFICKKREKSEAMELRELYKQLGIACSEHIRGLPKCSHLTTKLIQNDNLLTHQIWTDIPSSQRAVTSSLIPAIYNADIAAIRQSAKGRFTSPVQTDDIVDKIYDPMNWSNTDILDDTYGPISRDITVFIDTETPSTSVIAIHRHNKNTQSLENEFSLFSEINVKQKCDVAMKHLLALGFHGYATIHTSSTKQQPDTIHINSITPYWTPNTAIGVLMSRLPNISRARPYSAIDNVRGHKSLSPTAHLQRLQENKLIWNPSKQSGVIPISLDGLRADKGIMVILARSEQAKEQIREDLQRAFR